MRLNETKSQDNCIQSIAIYLHSTQPDEINICVSYDPFMETPEVQSMIESNATKSTTTQKVVQGSASIGK